jgi:hypothetical protein
LIESLLRSTHLKAWLGNQPIYLKLLLFFGLALTGLCAATWSDVNFIGSASPADSYYSALTPTPTPDPLAMPVLPDNPSPEELGRYSYYFNCSPCHGDHGQGLTDEWREVWVEDHQDCWARGCHAGRVDDQGFPIPTTIPAVTHNAALRIRFPDETALFLFLQQTHPPQRPGALEEADYHALAAYIFAENDPSHSEITDRQLIPDNLSQTKIVWAVLAILSGLLLVVWLRESLKVSITDR